MKTDGKRKKGVAAAWRIGAAMVALGSVAIAMPCRAADVKAAAGFYDDSCADCHGKAGKGDGPKAAELKTKPANYTDCAAMQKFNDDYLLKIIKTGGEAMGKSKEMPDFAKAYDDDEIKGLVAYVRSFCAK